jgi:Ca2+-binding RTX toxin-like protein
MAQDTAAQDNVTGITGADGTNVAAGLADPQYGFVNFNTTFGFQFPDGDFYNMGTIAAGSTGTIHVGGALDEMSVFVVRFLEDGTQVLAEGNGIDGLAIFTADPGAFTWSLSFQAATTTEYFVVVVDQTDETGLAELVSQSSPYVLSTSLADAEAQSSAYQGGSFALTGTSGAEGSFVVNGSDGGSDIDPDSGVGIDDLIELAGGDAAELLQGGAVRDLIRGLAGNDTLFGGALDDLLYGNIGLDVLYGNQDQDTMFGGQQDDVGYGGQGNDVAYGNFGNDVLYGNFGGDTLFGGQGDDVMFGGQGDDVLLGNLGDDFLIGNLGSDTMTGGGGADEFLLGTNQGGDFVTDFNGDAGDIISHLDDVEVTQGSQGVLISAVNGDGSITLIGVDLADFQSTWLVDLRVA